MAPKTFTITFLLCAALAQAQMPVVRVLWEGQRLDVGATEVTQELYQELTGENPSLHRGLRLPVESLSWHQATTFCNLLSLRDGLDPVYEAGGVYRDRSGWRLPTEQEWVALAELGGSAELARTCWFANNAERVTHPVGTKEPNGLGLYDLFGNVWEWCDTGDPESLQADRGGGYRSTARLMSAAARGTLGAGSWGDDLGFRIVRTVQE